ncbi:nucleotide-diphospho-sugar transferase [Penicillium cinerascens]|uniref:Nucleotide-diphospho-sugar transferase n=1 Tax=Penicillium cinerascens TaxID=70096 RepID=A0A9W9JLA8_9EURO|nr:nucleotide-diphospho-sugar transferase [Penicillium cinerascens]KAJ5198027.1 nucleotide-diphospho-sugar transferase [Penicillium cinerascens]
MVLYRTSRGLPNLQKAGAILFCTIVFLWIVITLRSRDSVSISDSLRLGAKQKEIHAFATILTGEGDAEFPDVEEPYLRAARLLTFQLLHNPRTRNDSLDIPFLVLVTQDVPQKHREILSKDGAIIVPVDSLGRDWIHPKWGRWKDVLAKLNLWQLTDYDKIMFLDADSVIFQSIHDIFSHPATEIRQTLSPQAGVQANGSVPASYMIAGIHDPWVEENLPPVPGKEFYQQNNYMNAGFFVLHPSKDLFDYYSALLDKPDAFDSAYPEQNLLNCAHRTDGQMPWQDIGPWWNLKGADKSEYESGLKSIHHKWWRPIPDKFVGDRIADALEEMESYFRGTNEQNA